MEKVTGPKVPHKDLLPLDPSGSHIKEMLLCKSYFRSVKVLRKTWALSGSIGSFFYSLIY